MVRSRPLLNIGLCGALDTAGPRIMPCAADNGDAQVSALPPTDANSVSASTADGQKEELYDQSMQDRKDEIDALRARVDVILNKMVQSSGDDVTKLRQKIAEMRTAPLPTKPQQPAAGAVKKWRAGDVLGCPLSPMTTVANASVSPTEDTEIHGNLTSQKKSIIQNEGSLLTVGVADETSEAQKEEDERDDDEEIDNMEFDFKVAPLALSKSTQLAENSSTTESRQTKVSKDPPAFLKQSVSMLPDPGGDESYCSDGSERVDSPPPGSQLFDAAARKAESVAGREYQKESNNQKTGVEPTSKSSMASVRSEVFSKAASSKAPSKASKAASRASSKSPKRASRSVSPSKSSSQDPSKVAPMEPRETKAKISKDGNKIGSGNSNDPPTSPIVIADVEAEDPQSLQKLERSKSPPPPVVDVSIPNPTDRAGGHPLGVSDSIDDSSLSRPPSVAGDAGEITMVEEVTDQRIRDPYGDKGLYTGVLVKRRPHGRGTMKYDDGRHYEGNWNHGRWHGVGRAIFANHDIFEGSYDMDQRHGHGMYQWNDGRVYTGQFFQDQRQGRGTYTWPDGAVYQGEFKAGHRHGQGMYRFADGSVYTGEWQDGKYHGVGECRWADGRSYRGEWRDGRANGYGVETRPDGTIRHDGEWKDDRPIRDHKRHAHNSDPPPKKHQY